MTHEDAVRIAEAILGVEAQLRSISAAFACFGFYVAMHAMLLGAFGRKK